MIGQTNLKLVKEEKLTRPEIDDLKTTVAALQVQEQSSINGLFSWVDYPLNDLTNGSHFNENTGTNTIPTGWTQTDAAQTTAMNDEYGFWSIVGSSGDAAWKFRKQTPFTIGSLATNEYKSFWVGPVIIKESLPTADLNYYFGVYRNNAGAIDENTFIRININWLNASSLWQIRAERKDGTTQTNGTYYPLARLPVAPLWLRLVLRNSTNRDVLAYFAGVPFPVAQMQLMNATVGSGITWGQVWLQFHSSRGAGTDDRIMVGGIDYSGDA